MFLLSPTVFPWDLAILFLIAFGASVFIISVRRLRSHKPLHSLGKICIGLMAILGMLGSLLTIYGSFIEPHILVTRTFSVHLPIHQQLTIAVVSDLHVGAYTGKADVRKVVDRINNLLPDLVLIPGDFIADDDSDLGALSPLAGLHAPLGIFAVMGNHDAGEYQSLLGKRYMTQDHTDALRTALESYGITVLRNEHQIITTGADTIAIAGTDDLWSGKSDIGKALAGIPPEAATILMAHSPDIALNPQSRSAHLIVSGHTHGGQFRLPFIGPIAPIPTKLGRKYDQGLFRVDSDTTLAITRGVGETLARARLFAWPEIMLLTSE